MRILILILMVASAASTQTFKALSIDATNTQNTTTTYQVNGAATWQVYLVQTTASKTINNFWFYVSAVAGTLAATDIRAELVTGLGSGIAATVTYTDATDLVNYTAHPFSAGDTVAFSQTGGALPAGIANDSTTYYVCSTALAANAFAIGTGYSAGDCTGRVTDFSGSSGTNLVRWLRGVSTTVAATPTGAAWVEVTGFTATLSGGVPYQMIIRNMNATPASNNFTASYLIYYKGILAPQGAFPFSTGFGVWHSTNSGSSMVSQAAGVGYRIDWSDSTYSGMPVENVSNSADHVQGTVEVGTRYTIPGVSGVTHNFLGASLCGYKNGTPTGDARLRIYTGANGSESLLGTTTAISRFSLSGAQICYVGYFSTAQSIAGGTVVRVMLSETTQSDTSTNYYGLYEHTIHNDANSKALVFGGAQKAKFDGVSTWTYTDTSYVPFGLIYDPTTPFTVAAAGGGGSFAISH